MPEVDAVAVLVATLIAFVLSLRHIDDAAPTCSSRQPARVNPSEADSFGNHRVAAGSSFGSLNHTAVGSAVGLGWLVGEAPGGSA